MARESGVTCRDWVAETCEEVKGPVSAECLSRDAAVLEATSLLSKDGVRVNVDRFPADARRCMEV